MTKKKEVALTAEQVKLGSEFLAMSNLCTIDPYRKKIVDLKTLNQYVGQAIDNAIVGFMESGEGGYDERLESEAIAGVEAEIKSFRDDLRGKRKDYWVKTLRKELPFLFK